MIRRRKLMCIILIMSMLVLGIYCEATIHTDSLFSFASEQTSSSVIRHVNGNFDTHVFFERNSLRLLQNFVSSKHVERISSIVKITNLLLSALLFIGIYLLSLLYHKSFLLSDGYSNQYMQRTLKFIHCKDGKKA